MYSLSIDATFRVMCGDIYKIGDSESYQGNSGLFIIMDMLSRFIIIEKVKNLNSL